MTAAVFFACWNLGSISFQKSLCLRKLELLVEKSSCKCLPCSLLKTDWEMSENRKLLAKDTAYRNN